MSIRQVLLSLSVLSLLAAGCAGPNSPDPAESKPSVAPQTISTKSRVEMLLVPGGAFVMGDEHGEDDEQPPIASREVPSHSSRSVTQASFQGILGRNPSKFVGPDKPAERVSWLAAVQYCNMRSARDGFKPCYDLNTMQCDFSADGYRLPTEAEWEYACRTGTTTGGSFGAEPGELVKHAWFKGNSGKTTHPVKQKQPNPWGLYDMIGNVAEWCNDFYSEKYDPSGPSKDPHGPDAGKERVLRGGSWSVGEDACRLSARHSEPPGLADVCFGYEAYGFRCVRKADGMPSPAK